MGWKTEELSFSYLHEQIFEFKTSRSDLRPVVFNLMGTDGYFLENKEAGA